MNLGDFVQSQISQGDAYEIIGTLGSGGFGTVWRVKRLSDYDEFAMKVPKSDPVLVLPTEM
jgi:serine/threonine protein kinase